MARRVGASPPAFPGWSRGRRRHDPPSRKASEDCPQERRRMILLVDDHAIVRDGLKRLLAGEGEIVEAASGREALALVRARAPELVILDLNLPGLGGLEL